MASEGIQEKGGSAISLDLNNIRSDNAQSTNKVSDKKTTLDIAPEQGDVPQNYLDKITAGKKINISL